MECLTVACCIDSIVLGNATNPALAPKKKAEVLRLVGRLACEACGLEPTELYGDRGRSVLECHHRLALVEGVERRTRLVDFRPRLRELPSRAALHPSVVVAAGAGRIRSLVARIGDVHS